MVWGKITNEQYTKKNNFPINLVKNQVAYLHLQKTPNWAINHPSHLSA
jgi:hypothetical protein